jgi:putative DNA primase/helicase
MGPQEFSDWGPLPPYLAERPFPPVFEHFEREEKARAMPCADIVEHFRGEPTSTKPTEWRWGSHGSLSVSLEKNCWFDHEANEGGDTIRFVERELGLSKEDAITWLLDSQSHSGPASTAGRPSARRAPPLGCVVATYNYVSESGTLLYQILRYDPKQFRQRRPNGQGSWQWSVRGVQQVPYRLPEVIQAVSEERTISIVEGEKDVDKLGEHGITATCNPGGAGKWRHEHSAYLRGADVVLIPDNDYSGRAHMNEVGSMLTGIAVRIRLLELPGLVEKGDVSDWFANGGTVEMLSGLIAQAPAWRVRLPWELGERTTENVRTPPPGGEAERSEYPDDEGERERAQETTEQKKKGRKDHNLNNDDDQESEHGQQKEQDEKSRGNADTALINELAKLDIVSYGKQRVKAAEQLGIRVSELDAAVKQRRAEIEQEQRDAARKTNQKKDQIGRRGFFTDKRGLWWRDQSNGGPAHHLAGQFSVRAVTRDVHSTSWGILIEWKDQDGQDHRWVMPYSMLAGDANEVVCHFLDGGLFISPSRQHREKFIEYLVLCRPAARTRSVDRTGWFDEQGATRYVLPSGEVIGHRGGEEVALQTALSQRRPTVAGDLEGWKTKIAARCVENSRSLTALSASFVGPLLGPLGEESFGIHFQGKSSIGKTGLARLGVSVWGNELRSWRTTDNSAESWCASANDGFLALDEISQGDGRSVDALAYMLAAGTGKGRANRNGVARPVTTWRIVFLSTGEIGLGEKLAEAGRRVRAGQLVRVIEIPAEAGVGLGVFENLHGFPTGAALADELKEATGRHTGHAASAFIARIAPRLPEVVAELKESRRKWVRDHVLEGADGEVRRVGAKFALIASAGELARTVLELPWPKNAASDAAAVCFQAWLEKRGGSEAHEIVAGIAQVRRFIERYGESRFSLVSGEENQSNDFLTVSNRAGWRRHGTSDDIWEYLITPGAWKDELCAGYNASTVARTLADKGFLQGGAGGKTSTTVTIKGLGKTRVYRLSGSILADVEEGPTR